MDPEKPGRVRLELKAELRAELADISDWWVGVDLMQAIGFLHGRQGGHGGVEYWKPGSFGERLGRQALARLLRGPQPLSRIVRNMLANLIDTEPFVARQLVMKHRGRTRLPASIRDHDVAYFIAWRVEQRMPMKAAKADALTHFKISNATMNRAWSKYGKETTEQVRRTLTGLRKMDLSRS